MAGEGLGGRLFGCPALERDTCGCLHLGFGALDRHTEVEFGSSSSPSGVLQAPVSYSQSSGDSCSLEPPCRALRAVSPRGHSRSVWTAVASVGMQSSAGSFAPGALWCDGGGSPQLSKPGLGELQAAQWQLLRFCFSRLQWPKPTSLADITSVGLSLNPCRMLAADTDFVGRGVQGCWGESSWRADERGCHEEERSSDGLGVRQ